MIHPLADVHTSDIGEGTTIWQFCVVLEGARIGRNVNLNAHCLVEGGVRIGDRVTVKCGVYLWNGVTLEDDVFIGPNATFTNDLYPRSKRPPEAWATTVVRRGASVGAGATIIAGTTIGEYALIGAGAVVTRDVAPHALVFGNPARRRGWACRCGSPLDAALACAECGARYVVSGETIIPASDAP